MSKPTKKKPKCRSWIVKTKVTLYRDVIVSNCTEAEAAHDPYACEVLDEVEQGTIDCEVLSVDPNE